jgi:hypothetical protein
MPYNKGLLYGVSWKYSQNLCGASILPRCPCHAACYYVVGWVDIGTVVKVPLNVVVYIKKVGKII